MTSRRRRIPKLGFIELSNFIADLILASAGEHEEIKHPKARKAWHIFFFSIIGFIFWHVIIRIIVHPSFPDHPNLPSVIRLLESILYSYLIISLVFVAYCHYRYILLPRRDLSFLNIIFFYLTSVALFARLYYSLFGFNTKLFELSESVAIPTPEFGVRGLKDLYAFIEFTVFSGCSMLNFSYPRIQSNSSLISAIILLQVIAGHLLIGLLVATFVQITSIRGDEK